MTVSTRILLAASLCLAPLGWAAAQDEQQRDDQHQRDHQEQHQQQRPQQQPQHNPQQQHNQQPQQGNTAPQSQHGPGASGQGAGGPGAAQQFQRPTQNNAAPPNMPSVQRPTQTNAAPPSPPAGATAAPTPPSQSQFQRVHGPPRNGGGAPSAQQQPQQQFQQRSVQRGAATGSVAPQAQPQLQQQPQQQTTTSRANFQGNTRSTNTASFAQHHGGAAPTQFNRGRFYGHDYAHFTVYERDLWHRGAWHHEFHDGRFGWWYAVDGIWYFYAEPIYPYPTYVPEVVYFPEEEAPPPVYVDAPPESMPPEPAPPAQYGPPPTYYYYFCPDTRTYYPYVSGCASPWQPVPTAPPQ